MALGASAFLFPMNGQAGCEWHTDVFGCDATHVCPDHLTASEGRCTTLQGCRLIGSGVLTGDSTGFYCEGTNVDVGAGTQEIQVNCCTPPEAVAPAPANAAAATDSKTATATDSSANSGTTQEKAQQEVSNLYARTASQSLTVGGLECLQGANVALVGGAAENIFGVCQNNLSRGSNAQQAAEEAARRSGKPAPEVGLDASVMGGAVPKRILEDFKKNFDQSGEDALHRLFKPGSWWYGDCGGKKIQQRRPGEPPGSATKAGPRRTGQAFSGTSTFRLGGAFLAVACASR